MAHRWKNTPTAPKRMGTEAPRYSGQFGRVTHGPRYGAKDRAIAALDAVAAAPTPPRSIHPVIVKRIIPKL